MPEEQTKLEAPQPDPVIDFFRRNYEMQKRTLEILELILDRMIKEEANEYQ